MQGLNYELLDVGNLSIHNSSTIFILYNISLCLKLLKYALFDVSKLF